MLKRLVRAFLKAGRDRVARADPFQRTRQLQQLHEKAQRRRDQVRSGRERLTTF